MGKLRGTDVTLSGSVPDIACRTQLKCKPVERVEVSCRKGMCAGIIAGRLRSPHQFASPACEINSLFNGAVGAVQPAEALAAYVITSLSALGLSGSRDFRH